MSTNWLLVPLLLAAGAVRADDAPKTEEAPPPAQAEDVVHVDTPKPAEAVPGGPKVLDGISILGNQEAPKALVIVPWKSSELGASLGITPMLDDSKQPVDREVFLRALSYHAIRSERSK